MSLSGDLDVRSSGSSGSAERRNRDKKSDPNNQASAIERSVTHLLHATKILLETLAQWSRGTATESEVSDIYVRLGYEFNIACRAFNGVGIDTTDLGPVPDTLRGILEETLSQEASQASLDRFLPRIRDIIINLLHGLKRKQQKLRSKSAAKDGQPQPTATSIARHMSTASTTMPEPSLVSQYQPEAIDFQQNQAPPETPSVHDPRSTSPVRQDGRNSTQPQRQHDRQQQLPPLPPPPPDDHILSTLPPHPATLPPQTVSLPPQTASLPSQTTAFSPQIIQPTSQPPQEESLLRPPPNNNALAQLQRGGELERRASRRFSAYQIQKHLGTSSAGVPLIPPTQRSPIPNRGQDIRESMNAVRTRGNTLQRSRSRNQDTPESSPSNPQVELGAPAAPPNSLGEVPVFDRPSDTSQNPLGINNHNDIASRAFVDTTSPVRTSATITTIGETDLYPLAESGDAYENEFKPSRPSLQRHPKSITDPSSENIQPDQPLTLFLQYKTKVKKFVLPNGFEELSVARLQLAFIEKFAWNTHSNGVDLPEIYVQDQLSGVRHELEDMSDVKHNSVLVLNVDSVDEVKRHFDDTFGGLKHVLDNVKTAIDGQQSALQRVTDAQQDAAKDLARFAAAPPSIPIQAPTNGNMRNVKGSPSQLLEIESLRRELAVMRQTCKSRLADMEASFTTSLKAKVASVKEAAAKTSIPSTKGTEGRDYVIAGKKTLSEDSEQIINRVDDLQDLVEDLRKDVVTRGVRPLPRQLENITKDISGAVAELKALREFLDRCKSAWTKVGENELKAVCDDQETIRLQEELMADLQDDLEKASQTFILVEQASKQQNMAPAPPGSRSTSRTLNPIPDRDPLKAKDDLLGEVKALQPNHETRLEAIERAERNRRLDLESRAGGAFKQELGTFVDEGRLKKTGGVEEAERLRLARDEAARREVWERQNGFIAEYTPESLAVPSVAEDGRLTPEFVEASEVLH